YPDFLLYQPRLYNPFMHLQFIGLQILQQLSPHFVVFFDIKSNLCRILRHMYLNNHTYYSLRYGTLSPQQLVEQAVACGMTRVVFTDINNTSALFEFYKACREAKVTPIAGIEFRQDNQVRYIG